MDSFWKNRTVFVTGANGFVGAHLVERLLRKNAKIVCLKRAGSNESSLLPINKDERIVTEKGSIEDFSFLKSIFERHQIDTVFHLAAQALVGTAQTSPLSTFETNVRGTYLLLEACRQSKTVKRIVVASSDKVYGWHENPPYTEDFPLRGFSPYDVSKSCADLISQSFAKSYNLPVAIIRTPNIYGPADLNTSRIIPGTIFSILKNENPIIRSDGTPIREFIYIDDVIDAYLKLAENIEKTQGETFNLGTNERISMIDLVNQILAISGKKDVLRAEIISGTKLKSGTDAQFLSSEKINNLIGWSAQTDLKTGLHLTFDWYLEFSAQQNKS